MNFLNLTYLYTTRRKETLENYENENLEAKFTKNKQNSDESSTEVFIEMGLMLRNFLTFKQFEQLYEFKLSLKLISFLLLLF